MKGEKKRPKDSGIGDGVGLHCGRDHGTQALPQEESNQLSNAVHFLQVSIDLAAHSSVRV